MSTATLLRNLSSTEFDTVGTYDNFSHGSSVIIKPLEAVETPKIEPLKNLSKFSPKLSILKVGDLSILIETSLLPQII